MVAAVRVHKTGGPDVLTYEDIEVPAPGQGQVRVKQQACGINFIDTCDFYSHGRSEEVVGRLIKELVPRNEIVLATKGGNPMGKGTERAAEKPADKAAEKAAENTSDK